MLRTAATLTAASVATAAALVTTVALAPGSAGAQESPAPPPASPAPSATATPHRDCAPTVQPVPSPVPAWGMDGQGGVTVTVQGDPDADGSVVALSGYTRPSTEHRELARGTTDANGQARIPLRLQGSTRLSASGGGCVFGGEQTVIVVRARLGSLAAQRRGPRDYTFSTFYAGPAGKIGSLYRVLPDGREVLTAQTRLGGEWVVLRRVFTGSGRFGFVLRTGDDITSLGASTGVRDTVVH